MGVARRYVSRCYLVVYLLFLVSVEAFVTFDSRHECIFCFSGCEPSIRAFGDPVNGINGDKDKPLGKQVRDVTFAAPLLDYGYPPTVNEYENDTLATKPLLLYLPGFDGTYVCPFIQFPELSTEFDVRCMTVGMKDRSTFDDLKKDAIAFIMGELQEKDGLQDSSASRAAVKSVVVKGTINGSVAPTRVNGNVTPTEVAGAPPRMNFFTNIFRSRLKNGVAISSEGGATKTDAKPRLSKRPIYLVGESFGGILASEVALTLLNEKRVSNLKGLILINAATCYDRSQLASKGPPVAKLPPLIYPFGVLRLLPLFADEYSFSQLILILQAKLLPSVIDDPLREAFMGRVAFSLPRILEFMPQGTLKWRLEQWLETGLSRMESKMYEFDSFPSFRTLIIAGEKDLTLPSIAEAERLANLLPNSRVHVVEGAGHSSTCGSRLDLTAVLRNRFTELQKPETRRGDKKKNESSSTESNNKRTAMKPGAAAGQGVYRGMEPRYDGADIGLNPLLYWSKEYYRPVQRYLKDESKTDINPDVSEAKKAEYLILSRKDASSE